MGAGWILFILFFQTEGLQVKMFENHSFKVTNIPVY